jgi:hypothetical protein
MDLKATFIHDKRPLEHLIRHKQTLPWDVITPHGRNPSMANRVKRSKCVPRLVQLPHKIKERSSGHDGLVFLASCGRYKEIHLWGFDSLTHGSCASDSLGKIDGSVQDKKRVPVWIKRFRFIFKIWASQGIVFQIHRNSEKIITIKKKT